MHWKIFILYVKSLLSRYFYPIHSTFLLIPTLSLISGIWWYYAGCPLLIIIIFIIASILYFLFYENFKKFLFALIFFFIGALIIHYRYQNFKNFHAQYNNHICSIRGTIMDISPS